MAKPARAQRKRTPRLKKADALRAMDEMLDPIATQLAIAIEIEASMEALNAEVGSLPRKEIYGSAALGVIQTAYQIELSLCLAKLFETPVPRNGSTRVSAFNKTDLASIPLLLRLLQQEQCKATLCTRNQSWSPKGEEVRQMIDDAGRIWCNMRRSSASRAALAKVSDYRHFLVHLLRRGPPPILPKYKDLFLLVDKAVEIMEKLQPAMTGTSRQLKVFEELWKDEARDFWSRALPATVVPPEASTPPSRGLSLPEDP